MNLVPCEFPEQEKRKPMWTVFVPMIREFVESGEECCRVEGLRSANGFTSDVISIRKAIVEGGFADKARLRTAKGVAYLVKAKTQQIVYR